MPREKDYSSYEGCLELCGKIEGFWRHKARRVSVWPERLLLNAAAGYETYIVQSDMVGGWPRG